MNKKQIGLEVQKAIERMKKLQRCNDIEVAHLEADDELVRILELLGYKELADEYNYIDKWYA